MAKNNSSSFNGGKNSISMALMAGLGVAIIILVAGAFLLFGSQKGSGKGCIGLVEVVGEIVVSDTPDSLFGTGAAGSETIAAQIEDASNRSDVKAIVVLIDSPGGSPVASRQIWSALKSSGKPTVTYMREMAASGGYYVAAGTDYIIAEPDTLTGSIGVRATVTDLSGLFAKIGYNETTFKSGEFKDIGSSSRPMTPEEEAIMQGIINETFEEFKGVVMESRSGKISTANLSQIFDARVMTGRQALSFGLVDQLGTKKDAMKKASQMAGGEELPICEMAPKKRGFLSALLGDMAFFKLPELSMPQWKLEY
jgi:protease IV